MNNMFRSTCVTLLLLAATAVWAQSDALSITPLTGDFYVYTTYNFYQDYRIPAHGMYLVNEEGVVLFDTPWDTTQFQPLLDTIQRRHGKEVSMCIATHWHEDRTAGLEYYAAQGIKTYTTVRTDSLSAQNNHKRAEYLIRNDTVFQIGGYTFETYYPGEGHTADNIVIWFNREKVLYGGCLIKGADADDLGYLGDANAQAYATTLKNVKRAYPRPKYILVSHHDWQDTRSLSHSIRLAKKLKRKGSE